MQLTRIVRRCSSARADGQGDHPAAGGRGPLLPQEETGHRRRGQEEGGA